MYFSAVTQDRRLIFLFRFSLIYEKSEQNIFGTDIKYIKRHICIFSNKSFVIPLSKTIQRLNVYFAFQAAFLQMDVIALAIICIGIEMFKFYLTKIAKHLLILSHYII